MSHKTDPTDCYLKGTKSEGNNDQIIEKNHKLILLKQEVQKSMSCYKQTSESCYVICNSDTFIRHRITITISAKKKSYKAK